MSVAVCGNKRSFFEEVPPSPPLSKRVRCSSSNSPARLSPSPIHHLRLLFPNLETQILEQALQECGNDVESTVKRIREFPDATANQGVNDGFTSVSDAAEWVDLFVSEMTNATSTNDARVRAARILDVFQKSIVGSNVAEATQTLQEENVLLKQQLEGVLKENSILKHGVAVMHERLKHQDEKTQEIQTLKQMLTQYQEQCRNLEVNNYALKIHLKQAQQSMSIPGRFHPDVF